MVCIHLGQLHALAGEWNRLRPLLVEPDQMLVLQELHESLAPRLRVVLLPTRSLKKLRRTLKDLQTSIERFNRRWLAFVQALDLTEINRLRDGYNRYYLLEKECAIRSAAVAQRGFRPLAPLTTGEILDLLRPLPDVKWIS